MRKRLVVSVVIGSMLFLQAPAQAKHLVMRIRPPGSPAYVETNCPAGATLKVSAGGVKQVAEVPDVEKTEKGYKKGYRKFSAPTLDKVANEVASETDDDDIEAFCDGHPVEVVRLPETGVTTTQELMVGVGLVSVGVLLLMFGRRPPAGRGPRRRRPPVKVYAQ
jgi:LPXTG-motif cell wall-anchored protein